MNNEEKNLQKTSINWFPGHMAKARREIEEKLNLVDIVIELVDARIPYSSRNPMLNEIIKNKPLLTILNKSDLADPFETEKWLKEYNKNHYTIKLDSTKSNIKDYIIKSIKDVLKEQLEKKSSKGIIKTSIRAMIIGIPNVGKSTFINNLAGRGSLKVGNMPGVTKSQSFIKVGNELELLDNPGILWPKFEDENVAYNLAIIGSIKDTILNLDDVMIKALKLLAKRYPSSTFNRYGVNIILDNIVETIDQIGKKRGALLKGGEINYDKVYDLFLYDLRNGRLGNITLEEVTDEHVRL